MPTLEQAIQYAAWESLVRLRFSEPLMAKSRAFYFLPARSSPGDEVIPTPVSEGTDPAIPSLISYAASLTFLNRSLLGELMTARSNLWSARQQLVLGSQPLSAIATEAQF
jgi:hypothetical protein